MSFVNLLVPARANNAPHESGQLLSRLILFGLPVWPVLVGYHLLVLKVDGWVIAVDIAMTAGGLSIPFILRATGSIQLASACIVGLVLGAVGLLSILNGGFAFHVLVWTILIPAAIPIAWRRFSLIALAACVVLYLSLFVLAIGGALPKPMLTHSELGKDFVALFSLVFLGVLLVVISRVNSDVAYAHVAKRNRFQKALLQSQKLGALGHLSDALVNEFNNVLMAMDYARHLLRDVVPKSDPRNEEIDHLRMAMERATALSRRLESFVREPAHELEASDVALVSVDKTLGEIEEVARRLASYDVTVSFDLQSDNAQVAIEPSQLDEIVVNLVGNAADAIEGKGAIVIATRMHAGSVEITVKDNGSGIPEDILGQLFEPFFTTKAPGSGTGLGLWSSAQAAKAAGGDLVAESELGEGTTMRLTLPINGRQRPLSESLPNDSAEPFPPTGPSLQIAQPRPSRLINYFSGPCLDSGARLWGSALVSLAFAGGAGWLLFAINIWLVFEAPNLARIMLVVALATAITPWVLRWSRSVPFTMIVLMFISLAGLAIQTLARGGFPLEILIFVLIIPLVASMQKEHHLFFPLTAAVCLLYLGVFFILALTGVGPDPIIVATGTQKLTECLLVLFALQFLHQTAARTGQAVDDHLVAECRQLRTALLRSRRLEVLGTFASSTAHDLNNVLVGLEFSTSVLDEAVEQGSTARLEVSELQSACTRIKTLAKQLVRFGRNDEGQTDAVEVDATLGQLEQMIGRLLGQNVRLRFDFGAGRARVALASKRLDQIVLNLLLNARDAMQDGGEAVVRSTTIDDNVVVEVSDNGKGIPADIRERVFEPLFSSTDDEDSAGIGLWLCRSVIEDAGGSLTIASTSEQGTTIRMTLPRTLQRHPTALFSPSAGMRGMKAQQST